MSPVNVGEVVIVPSWFGMEPSDIRSAINQLLTRSGGKRSGDHFTLDGAALGRLRREGIGIRIDRRIRRTNAKTRRNSEHLDEVLVDGDDAGVDLGSADRTTTARAIAHPVSAPRPRVLSADARPVRRR